MWSDIGLARLWQGDLFEMFDSAPDCWRVNAIITDPPYGIGFDFDLYDDTEPAWFDLMQRFVPLAQARADVVIMPCCQITRLPWWYANFPPKWLICWYKGVPGHRSPIGFNDWEAMLVWGKPHRSMHDHFFASPSQAAPADRNDHPCPKPRRWADWLIHAATGPDWVICDPFMGSGTVGVSAVDTGRRFVGAEMSPKYFEMAAERIDAVQAQGRLFA